MQIYNVHGIKIKVLGLGEPLVLLHGWGVNSSIWDKFSKNLSLTHQLYIIDLPGFGDSSYMPLDNWIKNITDFLPPKFSILGWSLGGLYALKWLNFCKNIEKIILLNSSPFFVNTTGWLGLPLNVLQAFERAFAKNPLIFLQNFIHAHIDINLQIKKLPGLDSALTIGLKDLYTLDFRSIFTPNLSVPIHCIFGKHDKIIPYKLSNILKTYHNCTVHIFENSGHAIFITEEQNLLYLLNHV